jgi:DNA-binding NarL/FixJ family response regulator
VEQFRRVAIRILLADDHDLVRRGLTNLLELDPELSVVAEAADGADAAALARVLKPDVALVDLKMPGVDGLAATASIRQYVPDTEVVAFTVMFESTSVVNAIQAGAIACLRKDMRTHDLTGVVKAAAAGQVHLTPKLAARLIKTIPLPSDSEALDEAEKRMLRLIATGSTNADVARAMGMSERSMRTRIDRILTRLGLRSRAQAVLYAAKTGLVALDEIKGTCECS